MLQLHFHGKNLRLSRGQLWLSHLFFGEICVLFPMILSRPSLERIQSAIKTSALTMHLFYTDQVDKYTAKERKSAFSVSVLPHPASCWSKTKCWMLTKSSKRSIIWHVWPGLFTLKAVRALWCLVFIGCPHRKFLLLRGTEWCGSVLVWPVVPELARLASSQTETGVVNWIPAPLGISRFWKRYRHCSSGWPCFLSVSRQWSWMFFPPCLPIWMICSALRVINEGWVHSCDPAVCARACG